MQGNPRRRSRAEPQLVKARIDANETPVRVSLDDLIGEAEADIANGR